MVFYRNIFFLNWKRYILKLEFLKSGNKKSDFFYYSKEILEVLQKYAFIYNTFENNLELISFSILISLLKKCSKTIYLVMLKLIVVNNLLISFN